MGIAERFPRAVENEGNLVLVFLVFPPSGISTTLFLLFSMAAWRA